MRASRYPAFMSGDAGLFGPDSVSWRVHRETSVLFGGGRALLLQAAHPLVIAGARETGFYEHDPWKRLERTLFFTYTLTFGSSEDAHRAADHINGVHENVHGIDPVTGRSYDALDPDLLLWVHACLVDSALLFERYTVGELDDDGRQRFHEEQMISAELLGLPRSRVPPTVPELRAYMAEVVERDLLVTDAARAVATLLRSPPPNTPWRTVLRALSWWAFGTLPPALREAYGVRWNSLREARLRAELAALRIARPMLPRRVRLIEPAVRAIDRIGAASSSSSRTCL
jgi:uncharacterized protein (DUF2236 family)